MLRYRFCFVFVILLSALTPTSSVAAATAEASVAQQCGSFVSALANRAIEIINDPKLSEEEIKNRIKEILVSDFSIESMCVFTMGKYNKVLSVPQKEEFRRGFINMLVKLYASNFKEYRAAKFTVVDIKKKTDSLYLVNSRVSIPGKSNVKITWSVTIENGKLRICDATQDEVSVRQIQRAEIQSGFAEKGVDGFMKAFVTNYGK
ncbi:MAG: ABC transporter substrate-binding protein [Holosporaceae bacterium]|jgi:ABC-type transporter MlaC component|nr:ABC transporter substrate-binding protein [Holosporaceae bacterium]